MKSFKERIEGKYQVDENGCWLWTGDKLKGYANVSKVGRVNRLMFRHKYGPIPPWLFMCHHCDVKACINPDHLYLGTNADNMRDKRIRDRAKGERSSINKLNDDQVKAVRYLLEIGLTQARVATLFDISQANVSCIKRGVTWSHLNAR